MTTTTSTTTSSSSPEQALQGFYQEWWVRWLRGLDEMSVLTQDFLQHRISPTSFVWIDHTGQTTSRSSSAPPANYGSRAMDHQYQLIVESPTVVQTWQGRRVDDNAPAASSSSTVALVTAQLVETSLVQQPLIPAGDAVIPIESRTQVSAWMIHEQRPNDDNGSWRLMHLHETKIATAGVDQDDVDRRKVEEGILPTNTTTNSISSHKKSSSQTKSKQPVSISPRHAVSHPNWKQGNGNASSIASRRRHVHDQLQEYSKNAKPLLWNGQLIGLSIEGWDIGTSQGPIGDATWFQQALEELEPLAQYQDLETNVDDPLSRRRQLALPEMVFPMAHVVLERRQAGDLFVSWDVMDCLKEWAECHQAIPMPTENDKEEQEHQFRGVSVLKTSDAKLWKERNVQKKTGGETEQVVSQTTTFHYDWTYSSPFGGTVYGIKGADWKPTSRSTMPVQLVMDNSVPILYFDNVVLLEDDLHDNGMVQYSVKVRIMPSCAYLLSRLFVRVDNVLIRIRETRLLVEFAAHKLYRDVTWRQVRWEDMVDHKLPTDVRAWKMEGGETPTVLHLLQQVPQVPVEGMVAHAELAYGDDAK